MSTSAQNEFKADPASFRSNGTASHRSRAIRVLFVHRDAEVVDNCLQELKKARFVVGSDVVSTLSQCAEQLRSRSYDVVLAEYPSPSWKGPRALQLFHQTVQEIPLLVVTTAIRSESIAQLAAKGAFDYVEREHLAQLPMAVRRALNERELH